MGETTANQNENCPENLRGNRLRILLVDDDAEEYLLTKGLLADRSYSSSGVEQASFDLDWVGTYEAGLEAIEKDQHDIYLVDYHLGGRDGLEMLREVIAKGCNKPIIVMTGRGSYDLDVEAMKAGATDYLVKGEMTPPLLERTLRYAIERKRAEEEIRRNAERAQALAIENARLYRVEAQRAIELDALHRATVALLSTIDLEALLNQILDAAQSAIPTADKGVLHLITPGTGELQVRAMVGFANPRIARTTLLKKGSYLARSVLDRKPILIRDLQDDIGEYRSEAASGNNVPYSREAGYDNGSGSEGTREGEEGAIRSAIVAPLVLGNNNYGALSLSASQPGAFSDADLRLLVSFAATTTAALQNAMLHSEVQKTAITDALTELYNRRGIIELGRREVERARRFGRPLSLMIVDLDKFKEINDTYGHTAGDEVLQMIAERLRYSTRDVDILGRYGGDEFIILLPETDLFMACAVAERIRLRIAEPFSLNNPASAGKSMGMTASLGVSSLLNETPDLVSLVERADAAAYQAKRDGRNRIQVG